MFIFDFVAETVLDQIIDWLYGKIVGFLNDFFAMMNNMGVELFDLPWVNAITTFFGWLGWALFVVGLVVGAFECAIEYQGGRGSIKDTALNYVKGFMAVSLFSFLPVNLYSLSVSLQSSFGSALSGITDAESIGMTAQQVLMSAAMPGVGNPILQIFCAVMMGYAVIKVFFGNLKEEAFCSYRSQLEAFICFLFQEDILTVLPSGASRSLESVSPLSCSPPCSRQDS